MTFLQVRDHPATSASRISRGPWRRKAIITQAEARTPATPQKAPTTMPAIRRSLTALLLAALVALGLTGCQDGTGLKDEGPATSHARSLHAPGPPHTKRPPGGEPGGLGGR